MRLPARAVDRGMSGYSSLEHSDLAGALTWPSAVRPGDDHQQRKVGRTDGAILLATSRLDLKELVNSEAESDQ